MMKVYRQRKYNFVSMLKTNRILYINNKQMNIASYSRHYFGKRRSNHTKKIGTKKYQVHSQKVILKSRGAVKLVCTRVLSHYIVKTLFTTNPAFSIESIVNAYSKRWSIEVFFKMSKQYLVLRVYQNRNLTATQSAVRLSLISYNLLTHVLIEEKRAKGKKITQENLAQFSVLSMRDHLRQLTMIDSMDYCLEQNFNKSKNKVIK